MTRKLFILPYMKIVFLLLITIMIPCYYGLMYGGDTGKSYFDIYTAIVVDKFREVMRNGNETLEIPIMDPFKLDQFEYNIREKFNIEAQGYLQNLQINKLSTYKIIQAEFHLFRIKVNVHYIWDSIELITDYNLTGIYEHFLPIYGLGEIDAIVKGLDVEVIMGLWIKNGYLYVRNLQSAIKLEELDIKVTGLFNNKHISNIISIILSNVAPQLVDIYQEELTELLNTSATDIINDLQKNNTLWDLIFNS
ncbi:PREDICTED: uncharacterized protein LOC107070173 [Polistes dominula]|uniref:Uncharacterized protein LOC107070173 n=1 Tax=Polistes dominula TaxID=743375 RepID=A0ABM1ITQ9_POLDO|nr:PREDICTED: uncharacterized protein LOC107070173 [Polistes dominula]